MLLGEQGGTGLLGWKLLGIRNGLGERLLEADEERENKLILSSFLMSQDINL